MDCLETSSNSSKDSHNSECCFSSTSNLSDLSCYQGEFLNLKHSLDPHNNNLLSLPTVNHREKSNNILHEEGVKNLTAQLQSALKQNEKYKNDIYNLEKKAKLSFNDKIEKLLKHNDQLESNLEAANKQIERLIHNYDIRSSQSVSQLERKIIHLEKINYELNQKNLVSSNDISRLKYLKKESETELYNLKLEFNDLNVEFAAKINCVSELKEKISQQHVQLVNVLQNNTKLSHSFDSTSNELESVKKSEEWYKNQLNQCQKDKFTLLEEIADNKKSLVSRDEKLAKINLELNKCKCECEQIQLNALREKESVLKQIEEINNNKNSQQLLLKEHFVSTHDNNNTDDVQRITSYYESRVSDLTSEVARIKLNFEEQQINLHDSNKKYSDLIAKYLLLQKSLQEREFAIEQLETHKKDLKMKLELTVNQDKNKNQTIIDLKSCVSKLEINLRAEEEEKKFVEQSVKSIKEQFKLFKMNYDTLKNEVHKKNQDILLLQSEKQELFMSNNWKTCELLEKIKQKDLEIEALQAQINSRTTESLLQNSKLAREADSFKVEKLNLESKLREFDNANVDRGVANFVVNNYANLQAADNANVEDILNYVCKLCELESIIDNSNKKEHVQSVLSGIDRAFQSIKSQNGVKDTVISELNMKIHRLKRDVVSHINKLKTKCKLLQDKTEENLNLLNLLKVGKQSQGNNNEDVKHLQALLQVGIREQQEKQKKYETNYRTLLRKVKEHMKGRNAAEKHNVYLQELHNNLCEDNNALKLQLDSYNFKIKSLADLNGNYIKSIEKLNKKVFSLEEKINDSSQCKNCINLEAQLQDYKLKFVSNDELIETFRTENHDLALQLQEYENLSKSDITKIQNINNKNKELNFKLVELEKSLCEEQLSVQNLKRTSAEENGIMSKLLLEKKDLLKNVDVVVEKNNYLVKELELANSCLHQKSEEIKAFEKRLKDRSQDDNNVQILSNEFKIQLMMCRNEIDGLKNDKFFLQRLCNDLRTALKIQVSQYKILKEYVSRNVSVQGKDRQEFSILPHDLSTFPSPNTKYDDKYIDKLLQENSIMLQDKPLGDIQGCLNTLRNEILVLQKQIVQKNVPNTK